VSVPILRLAHVAMPRSLVARGRVTSLSLLALAPNDWAGQWMNRQQLLSRLGARHHTVLYSTGTWHIWDRGSLDWRRATVRGEFKKQDNVWVERAPRFMMRWPRFVTVDDLVVRLHARRLRRWIASQNKAPLVAQIFHPAFYPFVKHLRPEFLVYHAYDLFDHQPSWTSELDRFERRLLSQADLAIASSDMIASVLSQRSGRPVRALLNAADVRAFSWREHQGLSEPADLANIPRPRIGYLGSLHAQINFGLIARLAELNPHWNFVFVGAKSPHADANTEAELADCRRHSNVHFLGERTRHEVPGYALNMDVNIMCYRLDNASWVNVAHPLKLHEYLASGRPIVSVPMPALLSLSNVIRFADTLDEWNRAITEALVSGGCGTPEEREAIARDNSWEARSEMLEHWLLELVNGTYADNNEHGRTVNRVRSDEL